MRYCTYCVHDKSELFWSRISELCDFENELSLSMTKFEIFIILLVKRVIKVVYGDISVPHDPRDL